VSLKFYSTNHHVPEVDFFTAVRTGQAPDRGLYMPVEIPLLDEELLSRMVEMDYWEVACAILRPYVEDIPGEQLQTLCREAYDFKPNLEMVRDNKYLMRLDTGPTASFKDFAAQVMSRLMGFSLKPGEKLLILTATSGDTGSAIANAFYRVPDIDVVILFPFDEVTANQRKQMTTLGSNIQAVAIDGKFDHAQSMVKDAFADQRLGGLNLTSANSINIARLVPQAVYYFWAYTRLAKPGEKIVFSVPSGNFGDMMGAVFAWKMGLPIRKLLVSTNANDEFPRFLSTGEYGKIEPSLKCISNAMNVGHPSNLPRLMEIFGGSMDENGVIKKQPDMEAMNNLIYATSVNDEETRQTILDTYRQERIILEPHGAVGWQGLLRYLAANPLDEHSLCVSLETADPAKFPEEITRILDITPRVPESLAALGELDEQYDSLPADYQAFYEYLVSRY